ncbi:death-associated protein kinase related [Frankliniella occidentalis]|uniref:Death-associated protein kinase related n=1 Tax=Frankliniella occidentalis TaxID=133901 RepID=A0A6J1SAC2_FRAOC|nr:death-associated protein kinase related [Frankliniella occidentalis]
MIKVDETDPVGELEPSFPYRDVHIKRNTDVKEFYDLQTEIGRGKFGTVYRCRERTTGLSLAAKFVSVARKEDRRNVEREVDLMRCLQHPRLLQLYDAFEYEKNVCLILELIEGGELFERVIDDDFVLTEKSCTIFMRQICEGIQFIHQQHILHLDLKPENILCLTKTGNRIKIIDFGLARRYEPGKKLQVLFGTPEFVAPEVVNFDPIGFNTDMWSVGVICYVLLSGLSPFMGDTDIETMANVTVAKYDFDDEVFNDISDDAKDFISMLLVKEKEKRMCAEACLHHRWLKRKPPPPPPKPAPATPVPEPTPVVTPPEEKPEVNNNSAAEEDKNEVVVVVKEAEEGEAGKLASTKDNLRNIVERWTEHPDSPYIFDTSAHVISPCPSLASVLTEPGDVLVAGAVHNGDAAEDAADADAPRSPTISTLPLPYDRLLGTERRASDSNCFVRLKSHHVDINDRINLADEIRKLSEKLFRIASWAPRPADDKREQDKPTVSPPQGNNVESTTVTETKKGCTTTKTTFASSSTSSDGTVTSTTSTTTTTTSCRRGDARLSDNFTARLSQTQIPTKRFWPIEPGRMPSRAELHDEEVPPAEEAAVLANCLARRDSRRLSIRDTIAATPAFHRLSRRSLSSASSTTTQSAPQSPRWSPDPELPPPPGSDITKDLLLRLLHRLEPAPASAHHHSLLGLGLWEDPFFRTRPTASSLLDKKRTLITSHSGGGV